MKNMHDFEKRNLLVFWQYVFINISNHVISVFLQTFCHAGKERAQAPMFIPLA